MKTLLMLLIIYVVIEIINYTTERYGFNGLHYSRSVSNSRCFEGDTFTLSAHMVNKKIMPVPFVELVEKMPAEFNYEIQDKVYSALGYNYHNNSMALLPFQKITRRYNITCDKRGRYYFAEVKVSIGDFFGFKTYSKNIEDDMEILVFPRAVSLTSLIADYKNPQGDVSVRRWIMDDPNVISGIREYTQRDPFNRIHWPSTARRGELTVKNFDYTSSQKVVILLNIETQKPFWAKIDGKKIESAIKIAASLSNELLEEGMAAGMFTNASLGGYKHNEGNFIPPSCSPGQLHRILEALARVDYSIQGTFEELLQGVLKTPGSDCHYIIITPIITEEMAGIIRDAHRRQGRISFITYECEKLGLIPDGIDTFLIGKGGIGLEEV